MEGGLYVQVSDEVDVHLQVQHYNYALAWTIMFCIKYDGGFDNVVTWNHLPGNLNRLLELN